MYNTSLFNLMDEIFETSVRSTVHHKAELRKTDEGYLAEILLPGFNKEEVSVEMKDRNLVIEANTERKLPSYLNNKVRRVYTVENIDADTISASLTNGILAIKFSTSKKTDAKKINIL